MAYKKLLTIIFVVIFIAFINLSVALPVQGENDESRLYRNVISVPPNCIPPQEWINGACRDVWRNSAPSSLLSKQSGLSDGSNLYRSVITVPPNCPPGQQWINGACRDVWRMSAPTTPLPNDVSNSFRYIITVPPNCPPGTQLVNGACREIWRMSAPSTPLTTIFKYREKRQIDSEVDGADSLETSNPVDRRITNIPIQCPIGYRPDALGNCRKIFKENKN